jgi:CO dehydrogenase/acetyl-CoA synthase delta subunit
MENELEQLRKENARLVEELKRLYGVDRPFICGTAGEKQKDHLHEYILVCPAYGADGFALYKKHKDYSAPGY